MATRTIDREQMQTDVSNATAILRRVRIEGAADFDQRLDDTLHAAIYALQGASQRIGYNASQAAKGGA